MRELDRQLAELEGDGHIAHIFDDDEERIEVLSAFAAAGLRRGMAVLIAEEDAVIESLTTALHDAGVDVDRQRASDALRLMDGPGLYAGEGDVDLDRLVESLAGFEGAVRESGYGGAWCAGCGPPGSDRDALGDDLTDYERDVGSLVGDESTAMVCLCLYDRRVAAATVVRRALRTHPLVVLDGVLYVNPFREPSTAVRGEYPVEDQVDWMIHQLRRIRETDERLRRQQASLDTLVENSPDVIVRFDRERRHLYVNPVVEEEFGMSRDGIVGKTPEELDTPDELAGRWREVLDRVVRTGEGEELTLEYPTPHGPKWYQCRIEPELGPDGEVESVLAIGRDVTSQKRTREELEEKTRELQERVKELRCLYRVLRVLQRIEEPLDERLREVVERFSPGWQYPGITAARIVVGDREFASSSYEPTDWSQRTDLAVDGETVGHVEVVYLEERPDADDGPFLEEERELLEAIAERIGGAIRQDRLETRRRQEEARFRSLIENTTDLISIVEEDGTVRYQSPAMKRLLGTVPEERIGMEIGENVHPEDHPRVLAAFKRLLEDPGLTPRVEYRIRHADGSWRHFESVGHNLLDDPSVKGIVAISRDVTERKRIEAERERLEERLQQAQKMEAVGRLAGGIAHDFNNLLTVIDGHVSFLLDEAGLDDDAREDAEAIETAAKRATDLTRQLLAFSRSQVLEPQVLDPVRVIRSVESLLERLIGEDVRLTVEVESGVGLIEADPSQLEQVLLNLAVNARDAMPKGGELTLELRRTELSSARTDLIPDLEPGPYVQIVVRDTGEGIPPADRERIFEPFFTTKETGSGLGLATAYGIVTQSGGHIDVRSAEGAGTTFTVYFPVVDEKGSQVEEGFKQRLPLGGGESVLLVEDEEAVRDLSRRVLEQSGYEVLVAENGVRALELLEDSEEAVDLVVTDVVMPEMSGKDLAERLEKEWPDTRVLFMSGYTDDAISKHGVLEPGVSFLQKPFTPRQLAKAVRTVLDRDD